MSNPAALTAFAHVFAHTDYSVLDGSLRIPDAAQVALWHSQSALIKIDLNGSVDRLGAAPDRTQFNATAPGCQPAAGPHEWSFHGFAGLERRTPGA